MCCTWTGACRSGDTLLAAIPADAQGYERHGKGGWVGLCPLFWVGVITAKDLFCGLVLKKHSYYSGVLYNYFIYSV